MASASQILAVICMTFVWSAGELRAENLSVLATQPAEAAPSGMLGRYLSERAFAALDRRDREVETLKTPEQVSERAARLRARFIEKLGGLPERTPLNARVVGTVERDGLRVEKIIFESCPGVFVTGLLYLPRSKPPYPGVLVPCGHSENGKAYDAYQRVSMLLAVNGIAAFCYDPIGQGERSQLLDDKGGQVYEATIEHTILGAGCILLGRNTATQRIWDGMRAIDYLCERPEIDANHIGCAGQSGGGTLTSYLMALDERIQCAAPSCYLTGFRRLIETIGPQDAEQDIHGQLAFGMDHGDYVLMRAPRPTLILVKTGDFFDIGGAWSLYREANRVYTRLGFPERVAIVEDEGPHGLSRPLREATVRWMRRWLLKIDEPITEPDFQVLSDEEQRCSPKGQVLLMEGARSIFDLNQETAESLASKRAAQRESLSREQFLEQIRALNGIRRLSELPRPEVVGAGSIQREGYRIDRLIIRPEAGVELPALCFVPGQSKPSGRVYIYLHGDGKAEAAAAGGPVEKLVRAGHVVLAVDLRGLGETQSTDKTRSFVNQFGPNWKEFFLAYLLGRSFVGMRTEDVYACAQAASALPAAGDSPALHLVATGEAVIPAVHAVALEPAVFKSVRLEDLPPSWTEFIRNPRTKGQLMNVVHGALAVYDWVDLTTKR